jgi:hypothetical protein
MVKVREFECSGYTIEIHRMDNSYIGKCEKLPGLHIIGNSISAIMMASPRHVERLVKRLEQ